MSIRTWSIITAVFSTALGAMNLYVACIRALPVHWIERVFIGGCGLWCLYLGVYTFMHRNDELTLPPKWMRRGANTFFWSALIYCLYVIIRNL